jgi:putative restriction endonuclease
VNATDLIERLTALNIWKSGDERAPHKPLLLLLALAAVHRGEGRLMPYRDVHERLRELLIDFGPPRKSFHPEQPFWRLQNDGDFWEIPETEGLSGLQGPSPPPNVSSKLLLDADVHGGFSPAVYEELRRKPELVNQIASELLAEHFPSSLHDSILDAVGFPWVVETTVKRPRDPEFRRELLRLYEHRCAVCGFDGRLGTSDLGLEGAHLRWHSHGGPDTPVNGLLLCTLHHRMLDRGALGVAPDNSILVSQHVLGGEMVAELLVRFSGRPLRSPQVPEVRPEPMYTRWHRREVFREPARPVS